MYKIKKNINLNILKRLDFDDAITYWCRDSRQNCCVCINKRSRIIKHWNYVSGKGAKGVETYIKDLKALDLLEECKDGEYDET
ncbi:MAG: hypothetical protein J6T10_21415 [Methanobrevibacter sp.]|nr:hypothetical protein [Methanobrevibacter sp.]